MPETDVFDTGNLEKTLGSSIAGTSRSDAGLAEKDALAVNEKDPDIPEEEAPERPEAEVPTAPGLFRRILSWLARWHPFLFLAASLGLMAVAWSVYPKPEEQAIPDAGDLYREGLDRLFRVMNPDLELYAATPEDEALAAKNAFLNLFIFHRGDLRSHPAFINPHLLLGEINSRLAVFNPGLAGKYYSEALETYEDARLWENRDDTPDHLATYLHANFIPDAPPPPTGPDDGEAMRTYLGRHDDEIAMRRGRRNDYLAYRRAEAELFLNRAELALPDLERLGGERRAGRRERVRDLLAGGDAPSEPDLRPFELGPDEHFRLDFLLAVAYDKLGRREEAKNRYQLFLASGRAGRDRLFVLERLAEMAMGDGDVYARVDPGRAETAYARAAELFDAIAASPGTEGAARDRAILGSARSFSALAGLVPAAEKTVVDDIAAAGQTARSWLERLGGQALPQRTLALPLAVGKTFAKPEMLYPLAPALAAATAARLTAFASGAIETPFSRRHALLVAAIRRYDRIAQDNPGTGLGVRAQVAGAAEAWRLGWRDEVESRYRAMLDPLAQPEARMAAQVGLAEIALDRGDLDEASRLIVGGMTHTGKLWLSADDADWRAVAARLGNPDNRDGDTPWSRIWETIGREGREIAAYAASGRTLDPEEGRRLVKALNSALRERDFYRPAHFAGLEKNSWLEALLARNPELLAARDFLWLNRLLLEASWPYDLAQKAGRDNIVFQRLPDAPELRATGLVDPASVASLLTRLARAWNAAASGADLREAIRMRLEGERSYLAVLDDYGGDAGVLLPELARNYEALAELREAQGRHRDTLAYAATAASTYLAVATRARGAPSEMESLLSAGDAFFRAGLLERTVESLSLFLERFGYSAPPGSETAMSVARAENLLGRSYWFLGDYDRAIASFSNNLKRRTPERYKSIYYIGRVLMEQSASSGGDPDLLGDPGSPLPRLDRDGDPVIRTALQAFNHLRQSPGIDPNARAWRWATFDLGRLHYLRADRARVAETDRARAAAEAPDAERGAGMPRPALWAPLYEEARRALLEALDRYPLRHNGGPGLSARVEPEDYADVMAARFEAEYFLANALLRLSEAEESAKLASLARTHFANLGDRSRYADALFDAGLDRFQLNAAVIREAVDGGSWDRGAPLPRTRLGDDEGPTHSPWRMRMMLVNSSLLLADNLFRAAERDRAGGGDAAPGLYRQAYDAYQSLYDRFGPAYGPQAMLGMADSLSRLGLDDDAANHYRMAENIARMQDPELRSDGLLDIGPAFWGKQAAARLRDRNDGYGF
ncbi:MAG: hypothetical protein LBT97_12485 [Planctomycetota bacterium]|jgi:hypothetical protein|nr:hypothetical protein [Planctomycetota bacterium]